MELETGVTKTIHIVYGQNNQEITVDEGEAITVGEIRNRLGDVLNLPPTAFAVIGNEEVNDDRELSPGETLQFIKGVSGSKG